MLTDLSAPAIITMVVVYGATMLLLTLRFARTKSAEEFVVASRNVSFGWGASTMSATWVQTASIFAAATAGYVYGISGTVYYAVFGGLGLLFIWKYGLEVRKLVPYGHTFPEFVKVRLGTLSQAVVGTENLLSSQYSLIINFTACATMLSLFSELSYTSALMLSVAVVLGYSLVSGIRASVLTDLVQMGSIAVVAVIIVPIVLFSAGGPSVMSRQLAALPEAQSNFFSLESFLGQGAPMMVLVLAFGFANATVWQRIWVVDAKSLKRTYITSGLMYMAIVFGVGSLGLIALMTGVQPADGDMNSLIPQVTEQYLPAVLVIPFIVMLFGAIASTADSDFAAMSSMAMNDVWKRYVNPTASDRQLIWVGRSTMVAMSVVAVLVASLRLDILTLVLIYGMVRAASVFPIGAAVVWARTTNLGFSLGVVGGIAAGVLARAVSTPDAGGSSYLASHMLLGAPFIVLSGVGAAVVFCVLLYPFARPWITSLVSVGAAVVTVALQVLNLPGLLTYPALLSSLTALGVGAIVCVGVSLATNRQVTPAPVGRAVVAEPIP